MRMRTSVYQRAARPTAGRGRARAAVTILVTAASAALMTGCGAASVGTEGSETAAGVAKAASVSTASPEEFARCMRENGVPEFQEPRRGQLMGAGSPEFERALRACQPDQPAGAVNPSPGNSAWSPADQKEYAVCMRKNGVPDFPDPGPDGMLPPLLKDGPIDPESQRFGKAADACAKHGPSTAPNRLPGIGS